VQVKQLDGDDGMVAETGDEVDCLSALLAV
jgi:hypothetical protein